MGPVKFRGGWKAHVIASLLTAVAVAGLVLLLYIVSKAGVDIPAPNGYNLFS